MIFAYTYSATGPSELACDSQRWHGQVERVYRDLPPDRERWRALLDAFKHESVDCLLLPCLQELGDDIPEICQRLEQLEGLNVAVKLIQQPATSTNYGQPWAAAQLKQLLLLATDLEARSLSQRLRQGHAENRLKTLPPPGRAPYGYRRGKERYVIDRGAATVVKDFFTYFLLYGSLRGAVRHIQRQHGKQISVSTGQRWLTHPVYRGDLVYNQQDVIRGTHPPLLAREEAAQVDRLLRRNRHLARRSASAPRSLAGLVFCKTCQSALKISRVTRPRQQHEYLYLCPVNCPDRPHCRALPYGDVLEAILGQICIQLPTAIQTVNIDQLRQFQAHLEQQILQKQNAISQIPALVEQGVLERVMAEQRTYQLRVELTRLQEQVEQLPPLNLPQIAETISLPQFWQDLSESERRVYLREFLRRVEVVWQQPGGDWQVKLVFAF